MTSMLLATLLGAVFLQVEAACPACYSCATTTIPAGKVLTVTSKTSCRSGYAQIISGIEVRQTSPSDPSLQVYSRPVPGDDTEHWPGASTASPDHIYNCFVQETPQGKYGYGAKLQIYCHGSADCVVLYTASFSCAAPPTPPPTKFPTTSPTTKFPTPMTKSPTSVSPTSASPTQAPTSASPTATWTPSSSPTTVTLSPSVATLSPSAETSIPSASPTPAPTPPPPPTPYAPMTRFDEIKCNGASLELLSVKLDYDYPESETACPLDNPQSTFDVADSCIKKWGYGYDSPRDTYMYWARCLGCQVDGASGCELSAASSPSGGWTKATLACAFAALVLLA